MASSNEMHSIEGRVLMKGNEVLAEAAMRAGCRFYFGYPITPQTELAAYMAKNLPKIGGTFLQAESELAAVNMVYGAGSAGARAMTSSSSPGVSLKSEGASFLAGADVPGVIVNVMRGGPGLGGIQPSQSDYFQATRALGHGDYYMPVLAPSTVQEMADLITLAFDLADEYRTPAMILADGMLGQMMEPVTLPPARDLSTLPAKPWATNGHKGERPHNVINSLILSPETLEDLNFARFKRYEDIKAKYQRSEAMDCDDAEIVVVAFGAASRIARTAVREARAKGIRVGLLRPITLWPFPVDEIGRIIGCGAKHFFSVELSMGQMVEDVKLAVNGRAEVSFYGRTGGVLPTPEEVLVQIERIAAGEPVLPHDEMEALAAAGEASAEGRGE
ncbi:MAG: 3-methyl-2-oxobutanoate dehydrogenase subunit VorB [Atopobiaceae bacterium]|nr:3-methyl-2-oxobutanoate dehydrogenase subunit VorB [Atopobiaceae bacterium]